MDHGRNLEGKVALITGASRSIGFAAARALGAAGARIVITARKQEGLDEAVAALQAERIDALGLQQDVADIASVPALIDCILERRKRVDIIVSNAGATWGAPAEDYPADAWIRVVDVNLNGPWALIQAVAARSMIPNRSGNIIVIASVAGLSASRASVQPTVAYNASKAAQINLARSLAVEWGHYNIRVNALLPGWFDTGMSKSTISHHRGAILEHIPLGRFGKPEDIGGPLVFLASDASAYITGQALSLDGGLSSALPS